MQLQDAAKETLGHWVIQPRELEAMAVDWTYWLALCYEASISIEDSTVQNW